MKRVYEYFRGIKGIALILYVQFIISADILLSVENEEIRKPMYAVVFLASLLVCPAIMRFVEKISIKCRPVCTGNINKVLWFLGFFIASCAVFGVYYMAYSPGAFSADSVTQLRQVVTEEYDNWHPVLHTLLFFKLPLMLSGDNYAFIVIFQLILFSLAASYAAYTILRHSNPVYAILSLAFILINPVTCYVALYPWKDVAFAITALLAASYAANAWFTKGEWLKKIRNVIAVILVLSLATIFRHNALLFTLPMLIAMMLYLKPKAALITAALCIVIVVLIEGPLYAMLDVEEPDDRQEEMLGVPISVIGQVAGHDPDALDEETKAFIYEVAPYETWANQYRIGNFNTVKFYPGTDYHRIEEEGAIKVVGYMLRCFVNSPKESFSAFVASTDIVYSISKDDSAWNDVRPYIVNNEFGIEFTGDTDMQVALNFMNDRLSKFMRGLYWYVGSMNLILIVAILSKLRFRKKSDWKRILPASALLLYNFGTMLLLSGPEIRMFYFSFVITPVLLLLVMREKKDEPLVEDKEPVRSKKKFSFPLKFSRTQK